MTVHYHGIPLTPDPLLFDLAGKHVCISFATKRERQVEYCLRAMQSILFDNGAFSVHQQGGQLDVEAYYAWLRPMLVAPHIAIIPDVIDGTVEQQRRLVATWPFSRRRGAPVWHLGLPLDYLSELLAGWHVVCLGSSGDYWQVGSPAWKARMHQVEKVVAATSDPAQIHGLRMMNEAANWWFLSSVDSVNVARNYKDREDMPGRMADRLDRVNAPRKPDCKIKQGDLFNAA